MVRSPAPGLNDFIKFAFHHPTKPHVPMHFSLRLLLLTPAITGWALAELPRKAPLTKYTGLWTNSPFTAKPPPPEQAALANPLEDYALLGVSPISGGYRVTMLNRKNPAERVTVDSDKPSGGFKVLSVKRKDGDPLGTVVQMASGSIKGSVSFEQNMLTLTPQQQPQPPQQPNMPQLPQANQPPQPGQQPGQPPIRQPRPRVVPPPVTNQVKPPVPPQTVQPGKAIIRPERRR